LVTQNTTYKNRTYQNLNEVCVYASGLVEYVPYG